MDIERKRGDTYPIEMTVLEDGAAMNISGCTFLLTVDPSKSPADAAANVFQLTGTVTDAVAGKVSFPINATQADNLGKFFYDVQMTDGSGAKRTIAEGKFTLVQDITKT